MTTTTKTPEYQIEYDLTVEILKDLVGQGLSGDELIEAFAQEQTHIRKVVANLRHEADEIALGRRKGATMEDIFEEE